MSNKLSQIIIAIFSVLLAFFCVFSHADTIFSSLNVEKRGVVAEPISNLKENSIEEESVNPEIMVVKKREERARVVEELTPHKVKVVEETKSSEVTSDENELDSLEKRMLEALKKEEAR